MKPRPSEDGVAVSARGPGLAGRGDLGLADRAHRTAWTCRPLIRSELRPCLGQRQHPYRSFWLCRKTKLNSAFQAPTAPSGRPALSCSDAGFLQGAPEPILLPRPPLSPQRGHWFGPCRLVFSFSRVSTFLPGCLMPDLPWGSRGGSSYLLLVPRPEAQPPPSPAEGWPRTLPAPQASG